MVALVSDAGTPLVSDPGYRLVRDVRAAGLRVIPLPGACAAIAALSVAGLPSDRFCFEGFLPAKASGRRERLTALAREPRTLVFYESSHRIEESLADLVAIFGPEREAVLARELTKLFETVLGDTLAELAERVAADDNQRKGEFVLVVRGCEDDGEARLIEGQRIYAKLAEHLKPSLAAKLAADLSGAPWLKLSSKAWCCFWTRSSSWARMVRACTSRSLWRSLTVREGSALVRTSSGIGSAGIGATGAGWVRKPVMTVTACSDRRSHRDRSLGALVYSCPQR